MNKSELIDALSTHLEGNKKAANDAVNGFIDVVTRAVSRGDKVQITGFGTFEKRPVSARTHRNPRTGAPVKKKKTNVPAFRAGQGLKDVVSGAKKLPKVAAATKSTATGAARAAATRTTDAFPKKLTGKGSGTKAATRAPAAKSTASKSTAKSTGAKATAKKSPATKASTAKSTGTKSTTKTAAKKSSARKKR
ncbi:hypothetical protein BH20ACT5_BH20ACT5_10380 [soil metagenome]